jgi:hypothetical protein
LSDPSRNRIRSDTRLKIKGRKNQYIHPAAWNFFPEPLRFASTIIYRCIALLQLLYRWQHQSRKLWMPPSYIHAPREIRNWDITVVAKERTRLRPHYHCDWQRWLFFWYISY